MTITRGILSGSGDLNANVLEEADIAAGARDVIVSISIGGSITAISNSLNTISASLTSIAARVTTLESSVPTQPTNAPTITTDPAISDTTPDPGQTVSMVAGTAGGGASTSITWAYSIAAGAFVDSGSSFQIPLTTGTGATSAGASFQVRESANYGVNQSTTRLSAVYTINTPTYPSVITRPSWAASSTTTLTPVHGTYNLNGGGAISDYHPNLSVGTQANVVSTSFAAFDFAAYPGQQAWYSEAAQNSGGTAARSYGDPIRIPGSAPVGTLSFLSSVVNQTTTPIDITTVDGTAVDWFLAGDSTSTQQKKSGSGTHTVVAGANSVVSFDPGSNYGITVNWSGGSPTASGSTTTGVNKQAGALTEVDIIVPSNGTTSSTYTIRYWAPFGDTITVYFNWSDGSASISGFNVNVDDNGTIKVLGAPATACNLLCTIVHSNNPSGGGLIVIGATVVAGGSGGGGGGGTVPLPTEAFDARNLFSAYSAVPNVLGSGGITVQMVSIFPTYAACPEVGGYGNVDSQHTGTVLGNAMRFGKISNATTKNVTAYRLAVKDTDAKETNNSNAQRIGMVAPHPNGFLVQGTLYNELFHPIIPSNTYGATQQLALFDIHPGTSNGAIGTTIINGVAYIVRLPPPFTSVVYTAISISDFPADIPVKILRKFTISDTASGVCHMWFQPFGGSISSQYSNDGANMGTGDTTCYAKCDMYFSSVNGVSSGNGVRPEQEMFYYTYIAPYVNAGETNANLMARLNALG